MYYSTYVLFHKSNHSPISPCLWWTQKFGKGGKSSKNNQCNIGVVIDLRLSTSGIITMRKIVRYRDKNSEIIKISDRNCWISFPDERNRNGKNLMWTGRSSEWNQTCQRRRASKARVLLVTLRPSNAHRPAS